MADERRMVQLDQLYEFSSGLSKPRSEFGEGYPFLSFKDVFYNTFVPKTLSELVKSSESERQSLSIKRGDVFLTRTSETMGELGMSCVALADIPNATFNGFTKRLRPQSQKIVLPEYAGYFFRSPGFRSDVTAMSTLSTRASLNNEMLARLSIAIPPLDEQAAIGRILKAFDDKIELNRRMNETLEAMARALFKSWFVDFDPIRAKAKGRDLGLPQPLADLFPDAFQNSEVGDIPRGWRVSTLGDQFEAVKGVSYKGSGLSDQGTPLHNLNSVYEGGGYKYEGIKYYNGEYSERHLVKPGDVIVANTEQGHDRLLIGYAAIVPRLFGDTGITSHHIYRLRPKPGGELTAAFLCHLLNSPEMHDLISGYANGTTVNMLPLDGVQQPKITVPPRRLVKEFDELAKKIEARREETIIESGTLGSLRDTLLPKLISGELRVKDAEKRVEALV
jgi:type I restriction enzyme S subunit